MDLPNVNQAFKGSISPVILYSNKALVDEGDSSTYGKTSDWSFLCYFYEISRNSLDAGVEIYSTIRDFVLYSL